MPRTPSLGTVVVGNYTYWGCSIRGERRRFGRTDQVSKEEALRQFGEALAGNQEVREITAASPRTSRERLTVLEVCDRHIAWHKKRSAKSSTGNRLRYLRKFCQHEYRGRVLGDLSAESITHKHLEHFLSALEHDTDEAGERVRGPHSLWHFCVGVQACWNWAAGKGQLFPSSHRPLAIVEKPVVPDQDLTQDMLITEKEIAFFLEKGKPYGITDILTVLYATGARPGELCSADVCNFTPGTNQLVITDWKNRKKAKQARRIYLNDECVRIVKRAVAGKEAADPIFTGPLGARWTPNRLEKQFRKIRDGFWKTVDENGVWEQSPTKNATKRPREKQRSHLTLYSFRDLWISQMLLAGEPIAKVAKMAGTSVRMIEKSYGHFYDDDLAATQNRLDKLRNDRALLVAG